MTVRRIAFGLLAVAVGVGAFFVGRGSVHQSRSYDAGYLAGREAAFGDYDGGWGYAEPYVVTLRRGGPGITYVFDRRWPMQAGFEYRVCGRVVCVRPAR